MEKMTCKECGEELSIKKVAEEMGVCPKCKKKTDWISDPEFFGFG